MVNQDILQNIITVTNRLADEIDEINFPVPRNEVFKEWPWNSEPQLRSMFNSRLRYLHRLGLITLTRETIALTQKGFEQGWS